MRFFIFLLLSALLAQACTNNYFVYNSSYNVSIYDNPYNAQSAVAVIPSGEKIIIEKRDGRFWHARYKESYGWIYSDSIHYVSKSKKKAYGDPLPFIARRTKEKDSTFIPNTYTPSSPGGGPVQVKGYYRKNGTYVNPHTRSAPRRKG